MMLKKINKDDPMLVKVPAVHEPPFVLFSVSFY